MREGKIIQQKGRVGQEREMKREVDTNLKEKKRGGKREQHKSGSEGTRWSWREGEWIRKRGRGKERRKKWSLSELNESALVDDLCTARVLVISQPIWVYFVVTFFSTKNWNKEKKIVFPKKWFRRSQNICDWRTKKKWQTLKYSQLN